MKGLMILLWLGSAFAFGEPRLQFDANHCELYVNSFGLARVSYMGTDERSLDVDLVINETTATGGDGGVVLGAGVALDTRRISALLEGQDATPRLNIEERHQDLPAEHLYAGSYQFRYPFEQRYDGQQTFEELMSFAFYVDVRRSNGDVVRLWQRSRGDGFTVGQVFGGLPVVERSLGIGVITYPDEASPIYRQRASCL